MLHVVANNNNVKGRSQSACKWLAFPTNAKLRKGRAHDDDDVLF